MSGSEHKRGARRIPRRIKAEFEVGRDSKKHVGFTSNLSATGMFLGTNSPYKEGTRVEVRLVLDEPLVVETIVVHSKRGVAGVVGFVQSGMGLRFLNPEPKLDALLGLGSSVRGSRASRAPMDKLSFEDSGTEPVTERTVETPGRPRDSPPEAPKVAPSEPRREAVDMDTRLAEAERDRERLEEMVEADDRDKRMLRQLVSKLEKTRDRMAAELAAGKATEKDGVNTESEKVRELGREHQAAVNEAARLRTRVADLEVALTKASSEPPQQASVGRRSGLGTWATLIAAAALGGLVVWLSGFAGAVPSDGVADRPVGVTRGIAGTEVDVTTTGGPEQPVGLADGSLAGSEATVELVKEEVAAALAVDDKSPIEGFDQELKEEAAEQLTPPDVPLVAAVEVVRTWAAAWSEQRVDEYLSCYATSFEPPEGLTLGEWRNQRRDRLSRPKWVRVELGPIEATLSSEDRAVLTFEQSYETPTYSDRVRKVLELVREEGTWRIAAERLETEDPA